MKLITKQQIIYFFFRKYSDMPKILLVNETEKPFPYRHGIIQLMHNT